MNDQSTAASQEQLPAGTSQLLYYTTFFTERAVPAGQELTYDYGENYHTKYLVHELPGLPDIGICSWWTGLRFAFREKDPRESWLISSRSQLLYYTTFFTERAVPAGQELTYDYGENYHTKADGAGGRLRFPCQCGAANCTGNIAAADS
uniref:Post-SET domain-containing protein n=1 Tax=Tetradesmus obliquus TaxID=3088 RepID=A0A383WC41_TETOB|eukprot:jgi/Sobl393_1/2401/SZX75001.1